MGRGWSGPVVVLVVVVVYTIVMWNEVHFGIALVVKTCFCRGNGRAIFPSTVESQSMILRCLTIIYHFLPLTTRPSSPEYLCLRISTESIEITQFLIALTNNLQNQGNRLDLRRHINPKLHSNGMISKLSRYVGGEVNELTSVGYQVVIECLF